MNSLESFIPEDEDLIQQELAKLDYDLRCLTKHIERLQKLVDEHEE